MSSKENETWSTKELVNYLSQSNEALRIENARLMDEIERLTNNIEVHDAEIIYGQKYIYNFIH
jgi:hypothetical protein